MDQVHQQCKQPLVFPLNDKCISLKMIVLSHTIYHNQIPRVRVMYQPMSVMRKPHRTKNMNFLVSLMIKHSFDLVMQIIFKYHLKSTSILYIYNQRSTCHFRIEYFIYVLRRPQYIFNVQILRFLFQLSISQKSD